MRKEPLTELGENFEFLRTIVTNKIELLKLDVVESSSKLLGYSVLLLVVGSFITLILGLVSCLMVLIFTDATNSMISGLIITIAVWALCIAMAYLMRRQLFYKPLANFIWTKFTEDDNK